MANENVLAVLQEAVRSAIYEAANEEIKKHKEQFEREMQTIKVMATEKRLIDANALDRVLEDLENRYKKSCFALSAKAISNARQIVYAMKDVDAVEVVHGRWIEKLEPIPWCEDDVDVYTVCSVCESYSPGESNYCPNCGALMGG